jgi:broad specificity phosphatase PhoE
MPLIEHHIDADLAERNYGAAEGLPVAEARERWPDEDYPRAEPLSSATPRAARVLRQLFQARGDSVVVAHGTLLRLGIQSLTQSQHPRILNGAIVLLEQDGADGYVVRCLTA